MTEQRLSSFYVVRCSSARLLASTISSLKKKKQIKISPIDTVHTQSLGDYDKDKVPIGWVVSVDGENYRITLMY